MDFGNNAPEFNWNYIGGVGGQGGQGVHGAHGAHGGQVYPQMGQVNPSWVSGGHSGDHGRQWLHSNQTNTYQQSSSPPAAYEAYNHSMMRSYGHTPKSGGDEMGHMGHGMSQMGGNFASYAGGMSRNGLSGMGHGGNNNNGQSSW